MSETLATSPGSDDEPATVEGRLAHAFIEAGSILIDEYRLSDADRAKVVRALRMAALLKETIADQRVDGRS